MQISSDYDPFARVYNQHWGGEFGQRILPLIDRLILDEIAPSSRLLDLACGTGQLAHLLRERGFEVIGVDQSHQMIRYARNNAPRCEFLVADARSFELQHPVHAAFSFYDSLNHILDLDDLANVFNRVYTNLKEDGHFLFDLNLESGYEARWSNSFHILEADHAVLVRLSYDPLERLGTGELTIFQMESGYWKRTDLVLTQRCYPANEILDLLEKAGFRELRVMDAETDLKMVSEVGRSFFWALK